MSYKEWFETHAKKHGKIIDKLLEQGYDKESIIEYFEFSNMAVKEKEFCPLYEENRKCHDVEYLNCYFCACPHFRFNDKGIEHKEEKTVYSFCSVASKDGKQATYGTAVHQDCSGCIVPHTKEYIRKHFDTDWKKAMKKCEI